MQQQIRFEINSRYRNPITIAMIWLSFIFVTYATPSQAYVKSCEIDTSRTANRIWTLCDEKTKKRVSENSFAWIGEDKAKMGLFPAKDEHTGKYGYLNEKAVWAIGAKYDRTTMFDHGIAVVELNGKSFAIGRDEKIKLDWGQRYVSGFYDGYAYILDRPLKIQELDLQCRIRKWIGIPSLKCIKIEGNYGLIDYTGAEIIKPICEANHEILHNSFPRISSGYMLCPKNGKYGLVNKNSKFGVEPIYDWIYAPQKVMKETIPGEAYKILETGFLSNKTQFYKVNFNNADASLHLTREKIVDTKPKNNFAVELFYAYTGFSKPLTWNNYPFHIIGIISGLIIMIVAGIFLKSKGTPIYLLIPGSILAGSIGGIIAGLLSIMLLALAAFIVFGFMLLTLSLARR